MPSERLSDAALLLLITTPVILLTIIPLTAIITAVTITADRHTEAGLPVPAIHTTVLLLTVLPIVPAAPAVPAVDITDNTGQKIPVRPF